MGKNTIQHRIFKSLGVTLVIIGAVFMAMFLLEGQTTVNGNYPEPYTSKTLNCEANNISFPFFVNDASISSQTKITLIFGDKRINSISLIRKAEYENETLAKNYSDGHRGEMNVSFAKNGLKAGALNANYIYEGTIERMSLYATSEDLSINSAQYFLLPADYSSSNDIEEFENKYLEQGFACITKE